MKTIKKKYYLAKSSLDLNIVGDFPQCQSFMNGLSKQDIEQYYSFYDYYDSEDESFPPQMPYLRGYKLSGRAKLTDFVSQVPINLLLVSPKALSVLENFNLGEYKTLTTQIVKRGQPYDYFFIYLVSGLFKYLKFEDFEFPDVMSPSQDVIKFNSISEFKDWRHSIPVGIRMPRASKIVMGAGCPRDLDVIRIPAIYTQDYYVSEQLKTEIEKNDLTGLEFSNATEFVFE